MAGRYLIGALAMVAGACSVFGTELTLANGKQRYLGYETWEVEADHDGIYELRIEQLDGGKWLPGTVKVFLDDRQVFFARSNYRARGIPDSNGVYRVVRHLSAGRHVFDVREQYSWPIGAGPGDFLGGKAESAYGAAERKDVERRARVFFEPVTDCSAFQFDDREDLVFRVGEKSELKEYRPDGTVIGHPVDTSVPGERTLVVKDDRGAIVFGPWSYVVGGAPRPVGSEPPSRPLVVDAVDCTEGEGGEHRFRDNGTSSIVKTDVCSYRLTGRHGFDGDNKGAAPRPDWFAYSLRVAHPQKAHLVRLTLPNDVRRCVPAFSHDPVTGNYNGWITQTGMGPASGPLSQMQYAVWPNTNWIDVMVYCSNGMKGDGLNREGAAVRIELVEYPDGFPALEEAKCGWNPDRECGWVGEQVDIGPFEKTMPPLWDDGHFTPVVPRHGRGRWAYDWNALRCVWQRFGEFSAALGQNWLCFPAYSYGMQLLQGRASLLTTPGTERYSEGDGPGAPKPVDLFDRDVFKLMLLETEPYGVKLVADFMYNRFDKATMQTQWEVITGLPARDTMLTANAHETASFLSASGFWNPAHPFVRDRQIDFYGALGGQYGAYASFGGVRTRFWKSWPGCLDGFFWSDNYGYEDWTVAAFAKETGIAGLDSVGTDEMAYALRRHRLRTTYGELWFDWRAAKCLSLREAQKHALLAKAPKAKLVFAGSTDEESLNGPYRAGGIDPRYFAHRSDLGFISGAASAQHGEGGVEWNDYDAENFYRFNVRPGDGANPPLEEMKKAGPGRCAYPQGYCNISCTDAHPYQLKNPALALADNRLDRLLYGGSWALPPMDEGLIAFTRIWRAIPGRNWTRVETEGGEKAAVAVWQCQVGDDVEFFAVNRTDRHRVFSPEGLVGPVTDLVTGEELDFRSATLGLDPYMPLYAKAKGRVTRSVVRYDAAELEAAKRGYAFLASLEPRAKDLVEVQECKGAKTVVNAGIFGNLDLRFTWKDVFEPIRQAYEQGALFTVGELLDDFARNHTWWYHRLGYPADFAYPKYVEPPKLPLPIREFLGIGPFATQPLTNSQHQIDWYAGVYPPETEGVRPGRTYDGLYGWKISWKSVKATTLRAVDLEKAFPECDIVAANDVGFLATWIYAPQALETKLYKFGDYYIELSLNGEKILARDGGPVFGYYDAVPVKLKAGWNEVLVRSSPGCTHHWNFGLAIDPYEGLRLSGTKQE